MGLGPSCTPRPAQAVKPSKKSMEIANRYSVETVLDIMSPSLFGLDLEGFWNRSNCVDPNVGVEKRNSVAPRLSG
jgi:hypothetical protein